MWWHTLRSTAPCKLSNNGPSQESLLLDNALLRDYPAQIQVGQPNDGLQLAKYAHFIWPSPSRTYHASGIDKEIFMLSIGPLVRVTAVLPLERFTVQIEFEDGSQRDIDIEHYLEGPIFKQIREDPAVFQQVTVEGGTLVWPNGADIDPDVLYYDLTPAWMEEPEQT